MASFDALGAFSKNAADPSKASRPFDRDRDGLVPSGGAAALVLEEYEHAKARGANILAEVVGYGFSSNGTVVISQPSPEGCMRAMQRALEDAGKSINAWVEESGLKSFLNDAGNSISAWADESGFNEWAQNVSAETQKLIEKNRPAVEAWLAQAGEDVKNAWNTLINAGEHTREEIEAALETVNDALNDAAAAEAAA